ncbi:hypothetical protein [Streptomyces clavifer]|uniref:hypothetical protein n=1 Tax=Streptomyces clavifer TaxID=68188 RepID=UPI003675CEF4
MPAPPAHRIHAFSSGSSANARAGTARSSATEADPPLASAVTRPTSRSPANRAAPDIPAHPLPGVGRASAPVVTTHCPDRTPDSGWTTPVNCRDSRRAATTS